MITIREHITHLSVSINKLHVRTARIEVALQDELPPSRDFIDELPSPTIAPIPTSQEDVYMDPVEDFERHTRNSDIEAFQDHQKFLEEKVNNMDSRFGQIMNMISSVIPSSKSSPVPKSAPKPPTPSSSK